MCVYVFVHVHVCMCVCVCVCVCVFSSMTKGPDFCVTKVRARNCPHALQLVLAGSSLFLLLPLYTLPACPKDFKLQY